MKKENIITTKEKCPRCGEEIVIKAEVKKTEGKTTVKIESQFFRINGVNYASENRVEFSPPFEPPFEPPTPPVEPRTWHLFRCVDINRNVKYGPVSGKFDPVGVGELERIGVKNATKDKIDSKNWFWEGKKIEA